MANIMEDNLIKINKHPFEEDNGKKQPLIDNNRPITPSYLERALSEAMLNDFGSREECRRNMIQQIIYDGGFYSNSTSWGRILSTLVGLSSDEVIRLRRQAIEFSKKVNPGDADPRSVALNFFKLFETLKLKEGLKEKVTVYSFGCGKSAEAKACLDYFKDRLDIFVGYDTNVGGLKIAQVLNQDPRVFFEKRDLSKGLPGGEPDLIIVRNPNVYSYAVEGQNTPNQAWRTILQNLRVLYPQSSVLVTALSNEEASLANQWIGGSEKDVAKNPFPTNLQAKFDRFGTFNLPVATDAYFIHILPK